MPPPSSSLIGPARRGGAAFTLAAALALGPPTTGQPAGEAATAAHPAKPRPPFKLPPQALSAINAQTLARPNLQVAVAHAGALPTKPGDPVAFTVTINNAGRAPAYRIRVTSESTALKIGPPGGLCDGYICPNGELPAGQRVTLDVTGVVPANGDYSYTVHAIGLGTGDNRGVITGSVSPPQEFTGTTATSAATNVAATPVDATPVAATPVAATPEAATPAATPAAQTGIDVSVSKVPVPAGNFRPGDEIDFTLVVANTGTAPAHGVVVLLKAANLTLVEGGPCSGARCEIGDLAPGASTTITAGATIEAAGAFRLFAEVPVASDDTQPANNRTDTAEDGVAYAFTSPPPSLPWPWIVGGGVAAALAAGAGARALQRRWWRSHIAVAPRFTSGGPTSVGPLTMTAPPLSVRFWIEKGPAGPAGPVPIIKERPDV